MSYGHYDTIILNYIKCHGGRCSGCGNGADVKEKEYLFAGVFI